MFKRQLLSMLSTLVLLISTTLSASTAPLEEAMQLKTEGLEELWKVSMQKLKVEDLKGELEASNWDNLQTSAKGIREVAALIIRNENNEIKLINMNMGAKSGGSLYFNKPAGSTILGRFHTHPYEYASLKDLPFSPRDVVDLYTFQKSLQLRNGYFTLIKSGQKYFALVVEEEALALEYFKQQEKLARAGGKTLFDYLYKKFYSLNKGESIQDIQLNSLILITGRSQESGLGLYAIDAGNFQKFN